MRDKDSDNLKRQITIRVKHQTRWLRRVPLLLGALGLVLTLIGCWHSSGPLASLGACLAVMGFGAQAVLWYGLRDEDRL